VILLDTHAAIWFMNNDPALGARSKAIALAALKADELGLSAISFWEIALLIAKRRLLWGEPVAALREQIIGAGLIELPLTGTIAMAAAELKSLHADPADRFIAATAVVQDAALMTADKKLLRWHHVIRRYDAGR
jgi:PIN domain nuclease of toxin-antitoxin system